MADYGTIARPYAKAIFEIASAANELAGWSAALAAAAGVMRDGAARAYLARPQLSARERAQFVAGTCAAIAGAGTWASAAGRNLLQLLGDNDRLAALPELALQFERLKTEAESKVKATLVSASAVDPAQAAKVTQALERKLGRKVELVLEVDPTLLGGAIVRAEDRVIDGSVRSRLERLAATLAD